MTDHYRMQYEDWLRQVRSDVNFVTNDQRQDFWWLGEPDDGSVCFEQADEFISELTAKRA